MNNGIWLEDKPATVDRTRTLSVGGSFKDVFEALQERDKGESFQ